jgi:light-regulated signal transduction histidine kinase (bacteriophytochrome)
MNQLSDSSTALLNGSDEHDSIEILAKRGRSLSSELTRRTLELERSGAQLERRERELKRSGDELEQLARAISHDLSQPLTSISGFAELLERRYRDRLDSDGGEFLDFILNASGRMRGMVEDLAAYIRIGIQPMAPADVDPSRVIEAVLDSLGSEIAEAGATITVDPMPMVRCDALQLGQLFLGLISNAVKFRGDEPPRVHISSRREQGSVRVSVADNGIGLDRAHAERAFEIFQRLQSSDAYPGNGTGLAICKKIVERHGGRIWVGTSEGSGTTVELTLPAAAFGV